MNNAFEIQTILGQYWLDVVAALDAKDQQIADFTQQVASLQPGYVPPDVPEPVIPRMTQLHAAFTEALTPEQQVGFAAQYAIVRTLVQADQVQLAASYVMTIEVPPEMEAAKQSIIDLLNT